MKTYITELGAGAGIVGGMLKSVSKMCPVQDWIPWMEFIGEILFQTGIGEILFQTGVGMTSLRAVSKVIPKVNGVQSENKK